MGGSSSKPPPEPDKLLLSYMSKRGDRPKHQKSWLQTHPGYYVLKRGASIPINFEVEGSTNLDIAFKVVAPTQGTSAFVMQLDDRDKHMWNMKKRTG